MLKRVTQWQRLVDRVPVAPADARAPDVSGVDEVTDDALRGAFGDADKLGDVPQPHIRVACDAHQHVRVVGQKRPMGLRLGCHTTED